MAKQSEHTDYNLLVSRYQEGDKDALRQLIRTFHPRLKQSIYMATGNQSAVDDLVQECWYNIIPRLESLKLKISFEAWALTIARRRAVDWIRHQQTLRRQAGRLKEAAQADVGSEIVDDDNEKLNEIRVGIQQLPMSQRIVLSMFYMENLSLSEISSVLDVSKGTVKSRLFYAREKLKTIINNKQKKL